MNCSMVMTPYVFHLVPTTPRWPIPCGLRVVPLRHTSQHDRVLCPFPERSVTRQPGGMCLTPACPAGGPVGAIGCNVTGAGCVSRPGVVTRNRSHYIELSSG